VATTGVQQLQREIEQTLSAQMPEVEVVLAERPSDGVVRVYIDRDPGGVDIELCQRVSRELAAVREKYALEVSSPGLDRPLTKPAHFQRVVGEIVAVELVEAAEGRRRFKGRLLTADDMQIELDQDGGVARIAYTAINRSHLVFDPVGGGRR
jgi:ribosome maturation factor RimP